MYNDGTIPPCLFIAQVWTATILLDAEAPGVPLELPLFMQTNHG
ncbi:MAG: hypothetical protein ABSA83_21375 [Verrucomicrobiota bacterium]|jgi:hypothetical protein